MDNTGFNHPQQMMMTSHLFSSMCIYICRGHRACLEHSPIEVKEYAAIHRFPCGCYIKQNKKNYNQKIKTDQKKKNMFWYMVLTNTNIDEKIEESSDQITAYDRMVKI